MQAGAGVGDQQFVLADLQDDAGARDGVADPVKNLFGDIGDRHFHGQRQCVNNGARKWDHEEQEEEREPRRTQGRPAAKDQEQAGYDEDLRTDFEKNDVLRTTKGVEQQAKDKYRPAGFRRGGGHVVNGKAQLPEEPEGNAENDGAVRLRLGGPDGAGKIDVSGYVEGDEPDEYRKPLGDGGALRSWKGGCVHSDPAEAKSRVKALDFIALLG